MSVELNEPRTIDALVEHLREADQGREKDMWETADLTLAAIADKLPETGNIGRPTKSGDQIKSFQSEAAREAAREVSDTVRAEGILVNGNEPKARTLLTWAATAHIWPTEDRVPEASFYAHHALNSPKYNGTRQARLLRLRDESRSGRVTETAVRMWIRGRAPGEKQTFLEKVDRRLRSAVKSAAAPWERTVEDDRLQIARMLRTIAHEIEMGEFH